jgi:hypothetical protein
MRTSAATIGGGIAEVFIKFSAAADDEAGRIPTIRFVTRRLRSPPLCSPLGGRSQG